MNAPPAHASAPRAAFECLKAVFMQVRSVWKMFMIGVSAARTTVGAKSEGAPP